MEKVYTNILPVPTFSWLGVNCAEYKKSDLPQEKIIIKSEKENAVRAEISGNKSYEICAENGKELTVIQFISASADTELFTAVSAEENSAVKLVQIFTGEKSTVSEISADISGNARLELIQIYVGTSDAKSNITAALNGRRSQLDTDIGYLLNSSETLDINLTVNHTGRKSVSRINADGVLDGKAHKTFKGTIDFRNGSSGAQGHEQENVILLSGKAVNKTVPVILCAEEDVEGTHGASIGRIDEKHIFYMRSRGIPEKKIYDIIARAKLKRIIELIGDEKTERHIYDILDWCEDNERS